MAKHLTVKSFLVILSLSLSGCGSAIPYMAPDLSYGLLDGNVDRPELDFGFFMGGVNWTLVSLDSDTF